MERVAFYNSLNQKLIGCLHRGPADGDRPGPTVVLCHGMMSSKDGRKQTAFARAFVEKGFSVLRFDFSFCGESGGRFEEITFSQEVDDLACAVQWVREQGGDPVGLLGSSMGGAVAILYAKQDPSIRALVTMAAVARPGRLADEMEALKDKMEEWREEGHLFGAEGEVGETFLAEARAQDIPAAARELTAPILILHGALDDVVPVADARILYEHAPEPKELRIFPEAEHRFVREEDLQDALLLAQGWFLEHLGHA